MKPSAGIKLLLNKITHLLNFLLVYLIQTDKEYNKTIKKPSAGLKLPLNKDFQRLNIVLEYVMQMDMV